MFNSFVDFLYLEMLEGNAQATGQCTTADLSVAVDTTKSDKPVPVSASSCFTVLWIVQKANCHALLHTHTHTHVRKYVHVPTHLHINTQDQGINVLGVPVCD